MIDRTTDVTLTSRLLSISVHTSSMTCSICWGVNFENSSASCWRSASVVSPSNCSETASVAPGVCRPASSTCASLTSDQWWICDHCKLLQIAKNNAAARSYRLRRRLVNHSLSSLHSLHEAFSNTAIWKLGLRDSHLIAVLLKWE